MKPPKKLSTDGLQGEKRSLNSFTTACPLCRTELASQLGRLYAENIGSCGIPSYRIPSHRISSYNFSSVGSNLAGSHPTPTHGLTPKAPALGSSKVQRTHVTTRNLSCSINSTGKRGPQAQLKDDTGSVSSSSPTPTFLIHNCWVLGLSAWAASMCYLQRFRKFKCNTLNAADCING